MTSISTTHRMAVEGGSGCDVDGKARQPQFEHAPIHTGPAPNLPTLNRQATRESPLRIHLPHLLEQYGETCKPTALAMLDAYHAARHRIANVPLRKNGNLLYEEQLNRYARAQGLVPQVSVRQIAKSHGSLQGEVLRFDAMERMATDMGYTARTESPANVGEFTRLVAAQLAGGCPLIAYFGVSQGRQGDRPRGYPSALPSASEHACLIVGIDTKKDTMDVAHWGRVHAGIPIPWFYAAMNALAETRKPESYAKALDPEATGSIRKYVYVPEGSSDGVHPGSRRTAPVPPEGTGFRNRVLTLAPNEASARWPAACAVAPLIALKDLGGTVSVDGRQHAFFIELQMRPAGHMHEQPRADCEAAYERTESKRSTANRLMRRNGAAPNGWNIQVRRFDEIGATSVIAKRLYSHREAIQLPGTEAADWLLMAQRSKLYRACEGHQTQASVPQPVLQAQVIQATRDGSGVCSSSAAPSATTSGSSNWATFSRSSCQVAGSSSPCRLRPAKRRSHRCMTRTRPW